MRPLATMAAVLALAASQARAGRPLLVDDAEPVETGRFQIEAGVGFARGTSDLWSFPATISWGAAPHLEIGAAWGWHIDREHLASHTESGADDVVLALKWNPLSQRQAFIAQTLEFGAKLPVASRAHGLGSGRADFEATWVGTRDVADNIAADVNIGYTWTGDPNDQSIPDLLHYGLAARWRATDRLEPVAEIVFLTPREGRTAMGTNVGLRLELRPNLVLDAAVGGRLAGDWPSFTGTVGFTWVF